ncbi:type IV secretion system protein [Halomonas casei]|uniref:type IV secretion system protein n=1 Tax=Halomonas casei TaxID=2742613 RepID=UPI003CF4E40B
MPGLQLGRILTDQIEATIDGFVTGAIGNVLVTAVPLVTIALTMSLMLQGLMMMVSPSGQPLSELLKRFFGIAMISSFATAGGFYQSQIANMIMTAPEEMSTALLAGTGITSSNITDLIDTSVESALDIINDLIREGGWRDWTPYLLAGLFTVIVAVVCGLSLAYLLVAKILLAIVVAFGPAFIFLLLFKSTRDLFGKWVGSVINYAILMVLLAAVLSFMMSFFESVLAQVKDGELQYFEGVIASSMLGIAAVVATLKLPGLASSWGGGIASTLLGFLPSAVTQGLGRISGAAPNAPTPPPTPTPTPGSPPGSPPGPAPGSSPSAPGGQNQNAAPSTLKYARD